MNTLFENINFKQLFKELALKIEGNKNVKERRAKKKIGKM